MAIVAAQVVDAVSVSTISLLERGVVPLDIFDVKFHVLVSPTEREIVYADVVRACKIMDLAIGVGYPHVSDARNDPCNQR